jgi:Holliday junction resolvase
MTGREFENLIVKKLHEAGYWVHRIHPDESGQQPFDIIAIKGNKVCAYDAKVLSEGKKFSMKRIEDNQLNAFRLFEKKTSGADIGLLIYSEDEKIRFMDIGQINNALWMFKKSIDLTVLPEWRII